MVPIEVNGGSLGSTASPKKRVSRRLVTGKAVPNLSFHCSLGLDPALVFFLLFPSPHAHTLRPPACQSEGRACPLLTVALPEFVPQAERVASSLRT